MIHRVKTVTWEVRSHGCESNFNNEGRLDWEYFVDQIRDIKYTRKADMPAVKRVIKHLQDVLKCMRGIEREKEKKRVYMESIKEVGQLLDESKKEKTDEDLPDEK